MFPDQRGLDMTASSTAAVAAFDSVMDAYLGMRPDTGQRLKDLFALDPDMPMAHVLKTYFFMMMATGPLQLRAQKSAAEARARADGAGRRELLHIDAAEHWAHGRKRVAIACWEAILSENPLDILALRLAHHGHFYKGDGQNLRDTVARRMYAWSPDVPGFGFVKGMLAFGLEETHDYDAALAAGHEAVDHNAQDPWAIHAVAHVHEMRGEPAAGIDWITANAAGWQGVNNFRYHVWWHRLLMHLDQGEYETVLRHYDEDVWDPDSDEYLDLVNDAALLARLELHGQDVGDRWQALAEKCRSHCNDQVLAFVDVHYALALGAAADDGVDVLLSGMRFQAETSGGDNALITDAIGLPLAEAILAHRAGAYGRVVETLLPIRYEIHRIGGSHAQRDLFAMILLDAAIRSERPNVARMLTSERLVRMPGDAWTQGKAAALGMAA